MPLSDFPKLRQPHPLNTRSVEQCHARLERCGSDAAAKLLVQSVSRMWAAISREFVAGACLAIPRLNDVERLIESCARSIAGVQKSRTTQTLTQCLRRLELYLGFLRACRKGGIMGLADAQTGAIARLQE